MDMPNVRIHLPGFPGGSPDWHAVFVLSVLHHTYPWMRLWMAIVFGNLNLRSNGYFQIINQWNITLGW